MLSRPPGPPSAFLLGLSELDAKLVRLLKASWRSALELDARMVALYTAGRDAAERAVLELARRAGLQS